MDEEEYLESYAAKDRIGFGDVLMTEIEGMGALAQTQKRMQEKQLDKTWETIKIIYNKIISLQKFQEGALSGIDIGKQFYWTTATQDLRRMYDRVKQPQYKNPGALLLAMLFTFQTTVWKIQPSMAMQSLNEIVDLMDLDIWEVDIYKYVRLLKMK